MNFQLEQTPLRKLVGRGQNRKHSIFSMFQVEFQKVSDYKCYFLSPIYPFVKENPRKNNPEFEMVCRKGRPLFKVERSLKSGRPLQGASRASGRPLRQALLDLAPEK